MSRATEIYPYKRAISRALENIGNDPFNAETILKYYNSRIAEGISPARIYKCISTLKLISKALGMQFEQATKDDIVRLVAHLESRDISGWTKRDYKVVLKQFYKWLRNCEDGAPPEVRWIKRTEAVENRYPILPKDLLTTNEKAALAKSALNPRDRALLEVCLESGRRIGEILTLHIRDVEFDEMGAKLFIHGKIGDDVTRIISSAPALAMWIDCHPLRETPESPVWIGLGTNNILRQISYAAARAILKNIAKRAGIKRRIHYYLFRHTRVDETQGILTEPLQCMMFGWRFGSKMPAIYMKRYGRHIDNAQALMNGMSPAIRKTELQKSKTCIKCNTENSPFSKFCHRCSTSLEIKFGIEVEDGKATMEKMLYDIISSPEKLEKLRTFLSEAYKN